MHFLNVEGREKNLGSLVLMDLVQTDGKVGGHKEKKEEGSWGVEGQKWWEWDLYLRHAEKSNFEATAQQPQYF